LATKLVGWNIDIRSEEELKKEVALQMGALIASGGAVPLSAIEGVTAQQADALADHGITDIDALASTSVDDLVDYLDVSLDEAESMLGAAQAVIAARDASKQSADTEATAEDGASGEAGADETVAAEASATEEGDTSAEPAAGSEADATGEAEGTSETAEDEAATAAAGADEASAETVEQHAFSAEFDASINAGEVEPNEEMIAAGYDEAVREGTPFTAESNILAEYSADPVAMSEADPISEDELLMQDAGRDLRPDTITPSPDITSSGAATIEAAARIGEGEPPVEEESGFSPQADFASESSAPEAQDSSALEPQVSDEAAAVEDTEDEKQRDASRDDAAQ
jgi:hypothetical protein